MKKTLPILSVLLSLIMLGAPAAYAAKPTSGGGGNHNIPTGVDISWPQCGVSVAGGQAFGIIGVNGGTANKVNPCLADQLKWDATQNVGGTNQPIVQLYVNTGNPGETIDQVTTWPTNNTDQTGYTPANPYGTCDGTNSLPCSWQYGWNRSVDTANNMFTPAASTAGIDTNPATYHWWLDVETGNSWESTSSGALAKNVATLEGVVSYYQYRGVTKVGIYSTPTMWSQIVGNNVSSTSDLNGLDFCMPGASTLRGAQSNCSKAPFTAGGHVTLTQYVSQNLDHDYSCV